MRTINVNTITENIKDMCIQANHFLADDMDKAMKHGRSTIGPSDSGSAAG